MKSENSLPCTEVGIQAESVSEQGTEEDIWDKKGRGNKEWRKLRNEELCVLYYPPNINSGHQIRKNDTGGVSGTYGRQ